MTAPIDERDVELAAAWRAGQEAAAFAVEHAMRAESDRLAHMFDDGEVQRRERAVEWGIGVAKAIPAVVAAARGMSEATRA